MIDLFKKYSLVFSLVLLMGILSVQTADGQSSRQRLRIMSYNTHHSLGMDDKLDLERLARVITSQGPTLVALQELDSMTNRTNHVDQLKQFAKITNMNGVFAKAIPYQGGSYGIGILSKDEPLSVKRVPIPGEERRVLLMAEFDDYVFACTHLDGGETYLDSAYTIIRKEAIHWKKPFIICGDWNCRPDNAFIKRLKKDFTIICDENSVPWDEPYYCIDYIAALNRYAEFNIVRKWAVVGSISSDHCPVCATVDMMLSTGLNDAMAEKGRIQVRGNQIAFPQAAPDDRVSIRTFDGKEIYGGAPKTVGVEQGNYIILLDEDAVKVNIK